MAACVAVIGKENSPLYVSCANPEQELSLHYSLHTSLDVVEEKLANTTKTAGADNRELYLGSLYSSEHQKVFGYVTNTRIKFIIITDNSNTTLRDNEIRQMFRKLHTAYTNIMANPFYMPGENISSSKFDAMVKGIMGIREN
eukprot:TRINITY_DN7580_c0_g1_i1.p1 TRINITY_DN7580_c0_g1~~TRINITY_DN7580_c0_g1_i1.p1  ORF type:complete len:142 (-),score=62.28 TRINITY_DN7580_c0_g1_i1:70-495(-)